MGDDGGGASKASGRARVNPLLINHRYLCGGGRAINRRRAVTVVCGRRTKVNLVVRCSEWMEVPPPLEGGGWCGGKKKSVITNGPSTTLPLDFHLQHWQVGPPRHVRLLFVCGAGMIVMRLWKLCSCPSRSPEVNISCNILTGSPVSTFGQTSGSSTKKNIWLLIERIKMLLDRSEFLIWQRRLEAW